MEERDELPATGARARSLGVRPETDIVVDTDGLVRPGAGGMSVSPETPMNLPPFRLPRSFGGTGKDPVWAISQEHLGTHLVYRPDPENETHGFIEPAGVTTFEQFQEALHETRKFWRCVGR